MRVAIIGSRNAKNLDIFQMIQRVPRNCSEIISGGAKGVDAAAKTIAQVLGAIYTEFPPEYSRYGAKAPMMRNQQIVGRADLVLAFWDLSSRGTAGTLNLCIQKGSPSASSPFTNTNCPRGRPLPDKVGDFAQTHFWGFPKTGCPATGLHGPLYVFVGVFPIRRRAAKIWLFPIFMKALPLLWDFGYTQGTGALFEIKQCLYTLLDCPVFSKIMAFAIKKEGLSLGDRSSFFKNISQCDRATKRQLCRRSGTRFRRKERHLHPAR